MRFMIRVACLGLAIVGPTTAQTSRPQTQPTQAQPTQASPSAEVKNLLAEWSKSLGDVRTLRVRFEQVKHLRVLRKPRVSSGEVLLVGKQLLMRVQNKKGQVETELAVQEGNVRIHYPRLKKLEVYPRDDSTKRKPPFPMMVEDVEELPRDYELRVEREGATKILVMKPRDTKSRFTEVRARFEDGRMQGLEQKSKRGDRVVLTIREFTKNVKLTPSDVKLVVPQGTKTVHIGEKPQPNKPKPHRSKK